MEDVTKRFSKNLKLSEKEAKGLSFGDDIEESARNLSSVIVCKVLKNRPVHARTFIDMFTRLWKGKKGVQISEMEGGRFLAVFKGEAEKKEILDNEPWVFNNVLVIMVLFNNHKNCMEVLLGSTPFWIQVHNIPDKYRIHKVARGVGSMLGEYITVKQNVDGNIIGKQMCIRVRLNIGEALWRKTTIDFPGFPAEEITFFYEKLLVFCQDCGKMDHSSKICYDKLGLSNVPKSVRNFLLSLRATHDVFGKVLNTKFNWENRSDGRSKSTNSKNIESSKWWRRPESGVNNHSNFARPDVEQVKKLCPKSSAVIQNDFEDTVSSPLKFPKKTSREALLLASKTDGLAGSVQRCLELVSGEMLHSSSNLQR